KVDQNFEETMLETHDKVRAQLTRDLVEYAWPLFQDALQAPFAFVARHPIAGTIPMAILVLVIFSWISVAVKQGILFTPFVIAWHVLWYLLKPALDITSASYRLLNVLSLTYLHCSINLLASGGLGAAWLAVHFRSGPSWIRLFPKGIRPYWNLLGLRIPGLLISWNQISDVLLIRPPRSTAPEEWRLTIRSGAKTALSIRLACLSDTETRKQLIAAMDYYAPHAACDPELLEVFLPKRESYTELWLQSLHTAPSRDRLKPLADGTRLKDGVYEIREQLGAGGQAIAYLAWHWQKEIAGSVVLKEIILPVYVDVDMRKRAMEKFLSETEMLARLDHPQIVKLIDSFIEDHRGYLVLEHIDGVSLRKLVHMRGTLNEETVLELADQMCEILQYLHRQVPPVVHRDFTPENLIRTPDGNLKLIDFTVAEKADTKKTATIVGKPSYMPPEQLRGKPIPASDIYAMGATLFYLLIGKDPEPISRSQLPAIPTANDDWKILDQIIGRATAMDPSQRYGAIDQLRAEIAPFVQRPAGE
ncbi:MAG TPA: serine/threonine-protein kinase, partial [Chroococcales cyanobacterium]